MWKKNANKKIKTAWYWFAVSCCRLFCRVFFRLRVCGKKNIPQKGPFLIISNHQSFLDPIFCGIPLNRQLHFLARDSLFVNRFFGRLLTSVNTIPVKRGQADLTAVKAVIAKLKEGYGVCLFPEATRSPDGKIAPFKPGLGLLCRKGNAAIVPTVIDGAFECWPKHQKIFKAGKKILLSYGKPITTEQAQNMTNEQLAENLTDILRQMQKECRLKQGKKPFSY